MQNSAQTSNYQANQDELVALYSGPEADCLQAWREKRPQAGAVQDGRPFVCAGRWALLRKQGWLPPDTYPNLCDWIPGSPGGSPLKACLYLPFFFLHIPPSPMKCESSGAWTSWTTHPCFPLLIPAIRELWSFPSLCISTLLPTLRPGQPGWPTLCSSLGKVSAPLWGGSPSHWSPPVRPSDWHWPQSLRLQCGRPGFDPWVGKIPWRRERLSTSVFWPGEFHGLYSPWGLKELDRTK